MKLIESKSTMGSRGGGMGHVWKRREIREVFWRGSLIQGSHLGKLDIGNRNLLKLILTL
jgi:hypothetical protein